MYEGEKCEKRMQRCKERECKRKKEKENKKEKQIIQVKDVRGIKNNFKDTNNNHLEFFFF